MPIETGMYAAPQRENMLQKMSGATGLARQTNMLEVEQFQKVKSHLDFLRSNFGALASKPDLLRKDFYDMAARGVASGAWTPQQAAIELSALPDDPVKLKSAAQQYMAQTMSASEQFTAAYGTPHMVNTGSEIKPVTVNPMTGVKPLGNGIPLTLTPEGMAEPTALGPDQDPNSPTYGQNFMGTRRQFLEGTGDTSTLPGGNRMPMSLVPPPGGGGTPATGAPPPGMGGPPTGMGAPATAGGLPINVTPDMMRAAAAAKGGPDFRNAAPFDSRVAVTSPSVEPPRRAGIVTSMPAGATENLAQSAGAWTALKADVGSPNGSATRVFQLKKALSGLSGANTGPGTEWQNELKSFVIANLPAMNSMLPKGMQADPEKVKDYDEAKKYLTAYASASAGSMGAGTNEKLATALSANASTSISNLAAQEVVKANMALERMKQAQADVFQRSGAKPHEFLDWSTDWNKNIDPRAFAVDLMSPKDRTVMLDRLKGVEKKRFLESVRIAIAAGVIDPASLQGK